jgi:hypothetical protein
MSYQSTTGGRHTHFHKTLRGKLPQSEKWSTPWIKISLHVIATWPQQSGVARLRIGEFPPSQVSTCTKAMEQHRVGTCLGAISVPRAKRGDMKPAFRRQAKMRSLPFRWRVSACHLPTRYRLTLGRASNVIYLLGFPSFREGTGLTQRCLHEILWYGMGQLEEMV